jgi:hypothetical protein
MNLERWFRKDGAEQVCLLLVDLTIFSYIMNIVQQLTTFLHPGRVCEVRNIEVNTVVIELL